MTDHLNAGRPKQASRELLQEAAFELFQLQGYAETTAEQIAKVAGFSRATFFNHFHCKSDVFWVEVDGLLKLLRRQLLLSARKTAPTLDLVKKELIDLGRQIASSDIPWVASYSRLPTNGNELAASGFIRLQKLAEILQNNFQKSYPPDKCQITAYLLTAATFQALQAWIAAGVLRGELADHLALAYSAIS